MNLKFGSYKGETCMHLIIIGAKTVQAALNYVMSEF